MKAGLHKWLHEKQLGGHPTLAEISGKDFINDFTDVLRCSDGHEIERTLASQACGIPKEFESIML